MIVLTAIMHVVGLTAYLICAGDRIGDYHVD